MSVLSLCLHNISRLVYSSILTKEAAHSCEMPVNIFQDFKRAATWTLHVICKRSVRIPEVPVSSVLRVQRLPSCSSLFLLFCYHWKASVITLSSVKMWKSFRSERKIDQIGWYSLAIRGKRLHWPRAVLQRTIPAVANKPRTFAETSRTYPISGLESASSNLSFLIYV
jgi:hypothetical protein